MARNNKPPKPLAEAPPEADSSGDDLATTSEEPEEEEDVEEEVEDEDEDESSDEEEETPSTPPPPLVAPPSSAKKPTSTAATAASKRPAPEDDDSETDDNSSPRPKIKPSSSSKPRSKSTVAALMAEKRPAESDVKPTSSKKPRKDKDKEKSGSGSVSGPTPVIQEEGKKLFQRVFSEEDEIEILKGMIEFRAKRGVDPLIEIDDFYAFVRKSVHADVNKGQIVDKVRRLKKKFFNAKKKKLSNPHEIQAFELSKKIWDCSSISNNIVGDDVVEDDKFGNGGLEISNNNHNVGFVSKQNPTATPKPRLLKSKSAALEDQKKSSYKEVDEREKGGVAGGKVLEVEEGEFEIGEDVAWEKLRKKGLRLMGARARAEIEGMWEKVAMKQAEAKMLRSEVEQEETRRIVEALRMSKH